MAILKRTPIRLAIVLILSLACSLLAQQGAAPAAVSAPPTNLKILTAGADLNDAMQGFNVSLGVQCSFCHVAGDFASDGNPRKDTARAMIAMVRQVEPFFPSTAGPFPRGYHEVDCMTCHRGKAKPEPPASVHFMAKRELGGGGPSPTTLGTNLKVLPPNAQVHGSGSIMEGFRDALNVDCGFCHGTGGFAADSNPRKDIARRMIELLRRINANFPGTGVFPEGRQVVTCNTCHRGDPHPASLSNVRYMAPATAVP